MTLDKNICNLESLVGSVIPIKEEPRNTACRVGIIGKAKKEVRPIKIKVRKEEALTLPKFFVSANA